MLEALFFQTYYAYLRGDKQNTTMFFDLLREEFNRSKNKNSLSTTQLRQLKEIRTAIDTGAVKPDEWVCEPDTPLVIDSKLVYLKQNDLVKKIHWDALDALRTNLNSDQQFHLYNIEHPCGNYGRIDMVYMDAETVYPTEIKRDQGRHDLLGQIEKYTLYFKMQLHLKHFKKVQPVTICHQYDRHVLTELKRRSVVTMKYSSINDHITLSLV